MLVKFFKPTESKGATGGLDYLLNAEGRDTAPQLLWGDPSVTRQLLLASSFKNQYTTGCLSFASEESDISKDTQEELMQSFEKTLLAGLEPNQYDIIWIKHTDKCRLELNFHVLNTELQTKKRLQPYLHQFDKGRIETWKSLQNDVYKLADPNAPERRQTLQFGKLKQDWQSVKNAVHNYLENAWINNEINNRDELLNEISKLGGEIKRQGNDYVSIKFPDVKKNIRLKGELYNENLGACKEFTTRKDEQQARYNQEREQRIKRNREKLNRLNKKCGDCRKEKYKYAIKAKEETKVLIESVNHDINNYKHSINYSKHNLREYINELQKRVSRMQNTPSNEKKQSILQTINKRYQRGKNIRNRLRIIRANGIRNRIAKRRYERIRKKLKRFAENIIKIQSQSNRERKLRYANSQRYASYRVTDKKNSKSLYEL